MAMGSWMKAKFGKPIMFAAHHKVDNLISTVDWNHQQIDGPTDKVMNLGNIREKFEAFGWTTLEMNGNDMDEVIATLEQAKIDWNRKTHCHYDAYYHGQRS